MADVRPFRGLRFNHALADPADTIAPPYDVISLDEQRSLYERSPHNVVRIEYGEQRAADTPGDNRYTRAAADLDAWLSAGVLSLDERPAIYSYRQSFTWQGERHVRSAQFAAVRLEPWDAGVIKPHEHTLSNPKADRLELLRATRTQVSPVYSLYRGRGGAAPVALPPGDVLIDCEADGQRHELSAITDETAIELYAAAIAASDVYIADGHHRYETALAYRDEVRARAAAWTGNEPENFVLMALTDAADPGLLVLPTHRMISAPAAAPGAIGRVSRFFRIEPIARADAIARLAGAAETAFVAAGLEPGALHLLTLSDRAAVESLMPPEQPPAWKRLDVSVLQYGILREAFGIDDAALAAGGAVTYTQDADLALAAVDRGDAAVALLVNATPVDQVLAVADAGGRMPQKSTYFYPKLPTGLVMRALER